MTKGTVVNSFLSRLTGMLMRQDSTLLLLIYQNPLKSPTLRLQLLLPRSLSLLLNKMLPLLQLLQRQTGKAAKIAGGGWAVKCGKSFNYNSILQAVSFKLFSFSTFFVKFFSLHSTFKKTKFTFSFLFSVIVPLGSNFDDLSSYGDEPLSKYAF